MALVALIAVLAAMPTEPPEAGQTSLTQDVGVIVPLAYLRSVGPSTMLEGSVVLNRWLRISMSWGAAYLPPTDDGINYAPGHHGIFRYLAGIDAVVPWSWGSLAIGLSVGGGVTNWVVDTWDPYCCGGKRSTSWPFEGVLAARLRVALEAFLAKRFIVGASLAGSATWKAQFWSPELTPCVEAYARFGIRL